MKAIRIFLLILIIIGLGLICTQSLWVPKLVAAILQSDSSSLPTTPETNSGEASSYKDATYVIEGQHIKLVNGMAESTVVEGSASKVVTRYFGNDLNIDLNNDGKEDVVFLLTQNTGGSGTFYYVVAALHTDHGYVGSDGYLLGDRVAPQTITASTNPTHKNVIVANYADRKAGEPMTTQPSVGKSAFLKLVTSTMHWGVAVPDF